MQEKNFEKFKTENESFMKLLEQSQNGNKDALENILMLFEDYISSLCKYINMPKEEVIQELYAELIEVILEKDINKEKISDSYKFSQHEDDYRK